MLFAGLGNAVGLLRNIQLGALQYQAAIAQITDGDSKERSSLSDVRTESGKQYSAGNLLLRQASHAMWRLCMHVLL